MLLLIENLIFVYYNIFLNKSQGFSQKFWGIYHEAHEENEENFAAEDAEGTEFTEKICHKWTWRCLRPQPKKDLPQRLLRAQRKYKKAKVQREPKRYKVLKKKELFNKERFVEALRKLPKLTY